MPSSQCAAFLVSVALLISLTFVHAQSNLTPQNSWPHLYPGMPTGDYSPEWQRYFQVTESLPNITWPLSRNWAGNLPVQRVGHPNNTLFFWAFESSNESFTANSNEPWAIWLNGGPGSSSLVGLFLENGPIKIMSNYSAAENPYTWSTIADYVWIDQPVGVGFSTVDPNGYVADEDQLGVDFMGFLDNFIKVFPNLASRPLYLTGESYAGTYIPYITKTYFQMKNPPVTLRGIAIGDGALTSSDVFMQVPVVTLLETYPQIIGYDTKVFEYFQEQSTLCGYDLVIKYPQPEHFPTLYAPMPEGAASAGKYDAKLTVQWLVYNLQERFVGELKKRESTSKLLGHGARLGARDALKRDLTGRPKGTIDPKYLCDLYSEMLDYAMNFTFPWSLDKKFDFYDIPDALNIELFLDIGVFLNDPRTRSAIHAPSSKDWEVTTPLVFLPATPPYFVDPSVEPMAFLTDLATNATAHGIEIVIYSGNDDSLVSHFGSQIAIQNTTFGGIQGFTRKPQTSWYNDAGEFGGIVHQERGWKYVLVAHAGHLLGSNNPISALTFAREFIFGNNSTGLVTSTDSGKVTVVGGEVSPLDGEVLPGDPAIYYGRPPSSSSYVFPSATVEAWKAYMATAIAKN